MSVNVEAGEIYFVEQTERIGVSGGRVTLNVRDAKLAQSEVESCNLIVSAYIPD